MEFLSHCLILLICIGHVYPDYDELEVDRSDWVDPTDMINFDHSTRKMVGNKKPLIQIKPVEPPKAVDKPTDKEVKETTELNGTLHTCIKDLRHLQKKYNKMEDQLEKTPSSEVPYFKQYIRTFIENIKSVSPEMFPVEEDKFAYLMTLTLSESDLNVLLNYVTSGEGVIQDAHSVMVKMIEKVELHESYRPDTWLTWLYDVLFNHAVTVLQLCIGFALCSVGVLIQVRLQISWSMLFFKLLILLFFVSIPWNWWHLYKQELAKRHSEAMKDMPSECTPQDQTMWQVIVSSFSVHVDKCAKYHERMMVDPMWEVAPTRAIAVTLTKFLLEPLEHIGRALGRFVRAPLEELPVQMWPIALAFAFLVFILVLIMGFGYKIRLPLWFGLEPSDRKQIQGVENMNKNIQALQKQLENLAISHESSNARLLGQLTEQKTLSITHTQSEGNVNYVDSRRVSKQEFHKGSLIVECIEDMVDSSPLFMEPSRSEPIAILSTMSHKMGDPSTNLQRLQPISAGVQDVKPNWKNKSTNLPKELIKDNSCEKTTADISLNQQYKSTSENNLQMDTISSDKKSQPIEGKDQLKPNKTICVNQGKPVLEVNKNQIKPDLTATASAMASYVIQRAVENMENTKKCVSDDATITLRQNRHTKAVECIKPLVSYEGRGNENNLGWEGGNFDECSEKGSGNVSNAESFEVITDSDQENH